MTEPIRLDPTALYDDRMLRTYGLRPTALERARKSGELRHTRRGGRVMYAGSWVQEWLTRDEQPASAEMAVSA
jgi:hypothetical protein